MSEKDIKSAAGTEVTLVIPNTEQLGRLKELNPRFSLTMKYKTAEDWDKLKNKPIRCFFGGIKEIPNEEGEMIKCGAFISDSEVFISGQMVLIDAVDQLDNMTPVEIIFRGKRKNKRSNGSTMLFDVTTLG